MSDEGHVITLVPREVRATSGVIEALESMLVRARAGEVVAVAIAGVLNDGATSTCYEKGQNIATLIGCVQRLNHRLLKHMCE